MIKNNCFFVGNRYLFLLLHDVILPVFHSFQEFVSRRVKAFFEPSMTLRSNAKREMSSHDWFATKVDIDGDTTRAQVVNENLS